MTMPVLGMVLKGYPRISETFISNEILLLEHLGIRIRIFSMRHPRESFSHASIKKIRARVDYLPTELFLEFPRLLLPAAIEAARQPGRFLGVLRMAGERFARTRSLGTVKHLLQGAFLANRFLRNSPEITHLHAHFAHSPTSVALFAGRLGSIDFSFTAHAKDIYT
ncbi:MAG TPA: colanic acid biosynthesis glycosyltransferase WcaL, partial [Desulfobacteraceae bacterium]|nr:colanic acid biosynthesis glycosyltransferase WcaL [Desulfobacteraceae bacterium]